MWKVGTPDLLGRPHPESGFNLFIAEGGEWKKVLAATRRRMRTLAPLVHQGQKLGATFQLDFGVMNDGGTYWP